MSPGDDKAASKEELGQGRQQVSDSRSRLLKLKTERDLEVSAVRVAADEREAQRRTKEEGERQVPGCSHTPKYSMTEACHCAFKPAPLQQFVRPPPASLLKIDPIS